MDYSAPQPQQGMPEDYRAVDARLRGPRDSMPPRPDDAARRAQAELGGS